MTRASRDPMLYKISKYIEMTTRAKVREAARSQATRSGRVPQSVILTERQAFDDRDLRLRSVGKDVRKREAPVLSQIEAPVLRSL